MVVPTVACCFTLISHLRWLNGDEEGRKAHLVREVRVGTDQELADKYQCIEQASAVPEPVQQTVRLSIDLPEVLIQVQLHAHVLVLAQRVLVSWKDVPRAELRLQVFHVADELAFRAAPKLQEGRFIADQLALHLKINPHGRVLADLDVAYLRLPLDRTLPVMLHVELLVVEEEKHVERAHVLQLLFEVGNAVRPHRVAFVAQMLVNVVAGNENDFEALVLCVALFAV